jgi:hypothetical protein
MYFICPGIHNPQLTEDFRESLARELSILSRPLILPTDTYPPFSPWHVLQFLQEKLDRSQQHSLIFISFSAGVVGAIGAAWLWQQLGNTVKAFIAIDGWGVPLTGRFPIHRLSHDKFTHWSSALLGKGQESFYAEPPTGHLTLWRSPDQVTGWLIAPTSDGNEQKLPTTAAAFLAELLQRYES